MHLSSYMGRNQSAPEQPLSLHCVLFGAVDMPLHVGSRHETPPPLGTDWNIGVANASGSSRIGPARLLTVQLPR